MSERFLQLGEVSQTLEAIVVESVKVLLIDHFISTLIILLLLLGYFLWWPFRRSRVLRIPDNFMEICRGVSPDNEIHSQNKDVGLATYNEMCASKAELYEKLLLNIAAGNNRILKLLIKLKVQKDVLCNAELSTFVESIIRSYIQSVKMRNCVEITAQTFAGITGISDSKFHLFSKNEKALLLLLSLEVDAGKACILMGVSRECIRTNKRNLKKKVKQHDIKLTPLLERALSVDDKREF